MSCRLDGREQARTDPGVHLWPDTQDAPQADPQADPGVDPRVDPPIKVLGHADSTLPLLDPPLVHVYGFGFFLGRRDSRVTHIIN